MEEKITGKINLEGKIEIEKENVPKEDRERFFEECRLKWKSTVEDIRIAKSQQWMTINYGFLLQFAVTYWIQNKCNQDPNKLIVHIPILIFIITAIIFCIFQKNMQEYRDLITRLEDKFTKESKDLVNDFYKRRPNYFSFWYGSTIPMLMLSIFLIVTIIIVLSIIKI